MEYRTADTSDIPAIAQLRSTGWGSTDYWIPRVSGYMKGERNPQYALIPRVFFVATDENTIVGFIAGHLSSRFDCEGELEWINVLPYYRRKGVATSLVSLLASWFTEHNARKVCVDPGNDSAMKFYASLGAEMLNEHWMHWKDISIVKKAVN